MQEHKGSVMRALRLSVVGVVIACLLSGLSVGVMSQSEGIERAGETVLFEVTIPADAIPADLTRIDLEMNTMEPGAEAFFGRGDEAGRGRAIYVVSGELVIEPVVDVLVWRQDARFDGTPTTAPATEATRLLPGDLVFLPAIPPDEVLEELPEGLSITNPGSEPAVTLGFHSHEQHAGLPTLHTIYTPLRPETMSGGAVASISGSPALDPVQGGDLVFRLSRRAAEAGQPLTVPEEASIALYFVEDGSVEATWRLEDGQGALGQPVAAEAAGALRFDGAEDPTTWNVGSDQLTFSWEAGADGAVVPASGSSWDLRAGPDGPARALELAVWPVAPNGAVARPDEEVLTGPWDTTRKAIISDTCGAPLTGLLGTGDGFTWLRDYEYTCETTFSDARLSGTRTRVHNQDCTSDGHCVYWGTEVIVGPEGMWSGRFWGTLDGDALTEFRVLAGDRFGGYEFATFIWHGSGTLAEPTGFGYLYEGGPPPMPDLVEPDAWAASYRSLPAADPVAAVDAWLDALVAGQWAQLPGLTCQAERGGVASFYGVRPPEDAGHDEMQGLVDAMRPQIVDRSVTLGAISGDTATVTIGGTPVYDDLEARLRPFILDITAGVDPSPSPEQVEQGVAWYAAHIRSFALAPEATVVREDGGWLTCTRLQVYVDPSPEP